MPRKIIATLLVIAICAFAVFLTVRWSAPPPGIEPKGDGGGSNTAAYAALATSVVSLATALVGLAKTMLEAREARRKSP